jgi:energy-coupling factor transporter transmembrane protein EcfT
MSRALSVPSVHAVNPLKLALGFLPWIAFSFASQRLAANGVAWAATLAVAMTLVSVIAARRRHGPKILNIGSSVLFAVIAVVGFVGGPAVDRWLFEWGRPLVGVVLGLYVLATVPVMPFTEEYARQTVPRQYWGSPTFKKINRVLSAAWGVAIVVMGAVSSLVTFLDARRRTPRTTTSLTWCSTGSFPSP